MSNSFKSPPKRFPWIKKSYTPDAVKVGFRSILDELNHKQRLETDPSFALKRKTKGIHANEGLHHEPLPLQDVDKPKKDSTGTPTTPTIPQHLGINDPLKGVIKAEEQFSKFQFDQGIQLMIDHQAPQTAADAQNLQSVQNPLHPPTPPGGPGL